MNAYDALQNYLSGEHGIDVEPEPDDEDGECFYDRQLKELILEYGQEQRKEGYKKGFSDAETEAAQTMDGS